MFNILFWTGYVLNIVSQFFVSIRPFNEFTTPISILSAILLAITATRNTLAKYKIKEHPTFYIITVLLVIIGIANFVSSENLTFIKLLFIGYSLCNMPFDRFIKTDFKIRVALTLALLAFSAFGLQESILFVRGEEVRQSLGFPHPNSAGLSLSILALEYLYLHRKHPRFSHALILLITAAIIHFVTGARTAVLCLIFASILSFILWLRKKHPIKWSLFKIILLQSIFPLFTILSFVIVFAYRADAEWAFELNQTFSNRLFYLSSALEEYPISFFGTALPKNLILDNQYFYLLLNCGSIIFAIYLILNYKSIKKAVKANDNYLIMILVTLMTYGIMEKSTISTAFNPFIIALAPSYFVSKEAKND